MKKSLRRKLIMSAVAVGAAAVATTSSTYAWFVSNSEVNTTEITGSVVDSNANLFVSNSSTGAYGTTVVPTLTKSDALKPITKAENAALGTYVDVNNKPATDGYVSFTLYFKATGLDTAKNTYTLNITKATATDKSNSSTDLYMPIVPVDANAEKGYGAITTTTGIWENVTKSMILSYTDGSTCINHELNTDAADFDGRAYYVKAAGLAAGTKIEQKTTFPETAHGFDNSDGNDGTVKDGSGNPTNGYVVKSDISLDSGSSDTATFSVEFNVWLDGTDDACFDAVAAHAWSLALSFKLVATAK